MKKLYEFYWDCGRNGDVEGMFIADSEIVESLLGEEVRFGEILGKHSDIYGTLGKEDLKEIDVSQQTIEDMERVIGSTVSGYNPLNYIKYICAKCNDKFGEEDVDWYVNEDKERICGFCKDEFELENLTGIN